MSRFIHELHLSNILSYDEEGVHIPLDSLNVIVGANGSGKSNLIEAISLLIASPKDMVEVVRGGGGIGDWLWKGKKKPTARIEGIVENGLDFAQKNLRHSVSFTASDSGLKSLMSLSKRNPHETQRKNRLTFSTNLRTTIPS